MFESASSTSRYFMLIEKDDERARILNLCVYPAIVSRLFRKDDGSIERKEKRLACYLFVDRSNNECLMFFSHKSFLFGQKSKHIEELKDIHKELEKKNNYNDKNVIKSLTINSFLVADYTARNVNKRCQKYEGHMPVFLDYNSLPKILEENGKFEKLIIKGKNSDNLLGKNSIYTGSWEKALKSAKFGKPIEIFMKIYDEKFAKKLIHDKEQTKKLADYLRKNKHHDISDFKKTS